MIVVVAVSHRSLTKLMSIVILGWFVQIVTTARQNVIALERQYCCGIKYITVRYPRMKLKLLKS